MQDLETRLFLIRDNLNKIKKNSFYKYHKIF
jgi:hypothetical protein